jgi:hypothetical protein
MRIIAIIAFLALIMPCIAEPNNVTTGPFKVSFDLGPKAENSTIEAQEGIDTEARDGTAYIQYNINIEGDTPHTALISVSKWQKELSSDTLENETTRQLKVNGNSDSPISTRTIDGHEGLLTEFDIAHNSYSPRCYFAVWLIDSYTAVKLISTYPWDEGTLSMLKTIHIEKINTAS